MKRLSFASDYGVNEIGQIYSYKRNKYLKPADNGLGYKFVRIKGHAHYVHRLVAEAFIPRPAGGYEINHKNKDKSDNRVENLEWRTHQDNIYHSYGNHDSLQDKFNKLVDAGVDPDIALYSL